MSTSAAWPVISGEVLGAIQEQNVQVAAGQIGQPPAPLGQSFQLSVNVLGRLTEVEQFEQIIILNVAITVMRMEQRSEFRMSILAVQNQGFRT